MIFFFCGCGTQFSLLGELFVDVQIGFDEGVDIIEFDIVDLLLDVVEFFSFDMEVCVVISDEIIETCNDELIIDFGMVFFG